LRRHWRNHVSAEACAAYIAGAGATKDQLEELVADESLALIDHYRIVRGAFYKGFGAASELGDGNSADAARGALAREFPGLRPPDRRAAARSLVECPEKYSGQTLCRAIDFSKYIKNEVPFVCDMLSSNSKLKHKIVAR
jgi:hypothetical protein